ncbi:MAG: leucine-rich repeat domain-containing protein [Eubacterium sp.]|nr:leucine-rich repeat domain-containing protein [Eubacterium sp.]
MLQKEGQKAFLLSDSILDDKRYNEKTGSSSANRITWETSTLRSWLNGKGSDANNNQIDFTGKGFIDVAFNNTEKCAIEDVNVDNHSTAPSAETNGGNDTNDKVFLLSEYDMFYSDRSASYGFCKNSYSVCDEARRGRGTAYAIAMGLNTDTEKKYKGNTWWLRSPGRIDNTSLAVSEGGHLDICAPCTNGDGIRPAVMMDLSNPDLWCYAGTVSSDGSVSGSLNSTVSWEYSGGILTIQGSGEMPDYNTASYYYSGVDSNVPWENYLASITRVTISGNITSIGNCCFACCPSLSELSLSSSIKEIGESAFSGCTGLSTFPFPVNLITIEDRAFMGCTGISEMDIPNCVQTIGDYAFSGCNGLRRIKLSSSLTEFSSGLFNLCRSLQSVTIPENVTEIKYAAFFLCSGLQEISIPSNVNKIAQEAFRGCSQLSKASVYNPDIEFGSNAFKECNENLILYGYADSTTKTYADNNGISFQLLTGGSQSATRVTVSGYNGIYDGNDHSINLSVSGPTSYTIYYSTSKTLNSTNYTSGTTIKPSRKNAGTTTVYYYIKDNTGNYTDRNGAAVIRISKAKINTVTSNNYNGQYDGTIHSIGLQVNGLDNYTVYYSTSSWLNSSNYSTDGSTTKPDRTNAGTTIVYYLVHDNNENYEDQTGSAKISISQIAMSVQSGDYSGTYDGESHTIDLSVDGPEDYSIYYSSSNKLTSSNYSTYGTSTKPARTNAGTVTVYYYVHDNSGNYQDIVGSNEIRISKAATHVSTSDYEGDYDGNDHTFNISVDGPADYTIYYRVGSALNFSDYQSGTTSKPQVKNAGTTTIYYYVHDNQGNYEDYSGNVHIKIKEKEAPPVPTSGKKEETTQVKTTQTTTEKKVQTTTTKESQTTTAKKKQTRKTKTKKKTLNKRGMIISVKSKKRYTLTMKWKKIPGITGYEFQVSRNKKFKNKGRDKLRYNKKVTHDTLDWQSGIWFIRMRPYRKAGKVKIDGKWSKVKKVKVK